MTYYIDDSGVNFLVPHQIKLYEAIKLTDQMPKHHLVCLTDSKPVALPLALTALQYGASRFKERFKISVQIYGQCDRMVCQVFTVNGTSNSLVELL